VGVGFFETFRGDLKMKTENWAKIGLGCAFIGIICSMIVRILTYYGVGMLGAMEANPVYAPFIGDNIGLIIVIPLFLFAGMIFIMGYYVKQTRIKYEFSNPKKYRDIIKTVSVIFILVAGIMIWNLINDFTVLERMIIAKCVVI